MFNIDIKKINAIAKTKSHDDKVYKAAKYYASEGFSVLPLRKNAKALPRANQGVSYKNATTDLAQIKRWFDPTEGIFIGWNLGIGCGGGENGILVVDIDVATDVAEEKKKNGFPQWYTLLNENETHQTIIQQTPSGGQHWLFQNPMGIKSHTDVLGRGIDIKAGANEIKSHIVVFPSIINGEEYIWKQGGGTSVTPQWLVDLLKINKSKKFNEVKPDYIKDGDSGNELMSDDDLPLEFSENDINQMLGSIPIDSVSYDDWLAIGMAIHSEFADERGLLIWDNWSKLGVRYKNNECNSRWTGFESENGENQITMGTLVYLAQAYGFDISKLNPKDTKNPGKEIDIISKINQSSFVNLSANSFKVCIEYDDNLRTLSRADFIHHYENQKVVVGRKLVNPANIWLASTARRELKGYKFAPQMSIDECEEKGYYNLFRGFKYNAVNHNTTGLELFLSFVKKVVCSNNTVIFDWVIDWMADIIQNPSDPKGTALVLVGDEGIGKGVMVKIFSQVLGKYFCKDNGGIKIAGKFNGFLENSLLLFADEMTRSTGIKVQQTLKALITGEELLLESKGLDVKNTVLMARLIIASNDYAVIRGERTSRRYLSLEVTNEHINDHSYFDKLFKHCSTDEFCEDLMFLLESRDLGTGSHLRKAPVTSLLERQKITNILEQNNVIMWLYLCVDNQCFGINDLTDPVLTAHDWCTTFNRTELRKEYEDWCLVMRKPAISPIAFYDILRKTGFEDKKVKRHNKSYRAFAVPTIEEMQQALSKYLGVEWTTLDNAVGNH
jgi:hypothetical protein